MRYVPDYPRRMRDRGKVRTMHTSDGQHSVTAKTVVVADDTAFVRDRFRAALENAGHKAVTVKSAAELLRASAPTWPPSI